MKSIWHTTAVLPRFPAQEKDVHTEVLIIGGGMAGLLCAYMLRQAGADCVVVERDTICGRTTGCTTAKITSQHGLIYHKLLRRYGEEAARIYYRANEEALRQYAKMAEEIDCDFHRCSAYIYGARESSAMKKEWDALQRLGIRAEYTKQTELPFPVGGAIRFPKQARFHPLKFAAAITKNLRIYENTTVLSYDGNRFHTNHGTITADQTIVTTHFPLFNKHGVYFMKMYQDRSYVLALEQVPVPEGMYLSEDDSLSVRSHGRYLLLGGGGHRTGEKGTGWTELVQVARERYSGGKICGRWATQDCTTLDGIPYIGRYSAHTPGLYVATGFNKWGMTGSMVSSMILSDLVQGKNNPWAELFSPSRPMAIPQLMKNGIHAAGRLLTPGPPRCPHLGCALSWNPQEHSWDCSCHGSRFDAEGAMLDNPANENMKRRPPSI